MPRSAAFRPRPAQTTRRAQTSPTAGPHDLDRRCQRPRSSVVSERRPHKSRELCLPAWSTPQQHEDRRSGWLPRLDDDSECEGGPWRSPLLDARVSFEHFMIVNQCCTAVRSSSTRTGESRTLRGSVRYLRKLSVRRMCEIRAPSKKPSGRRASPTLSGAWSRPPRPLWCCPDPVVSRPARHAAPKRGGTPKNGSDPQGDIGDDDAG